MVRLRDVHSGLPVGRPAETRSSLDHISVCVCTFKRPALLATLLDALAAQTTGSVFAYDVVIVDNDVNRSAEDIVRGQAGRAPVPLAYDCEPERNISLARNRAVRNARGNLIAFIDDDERPESDWLLRLHQTLRAHDADAVMAPVIPDFPTEAPQWLKDGRFFDRKRHTTGARIGPADARTGNVLLRRSLFDDCQTWFDPAFGRTGGEDSDFFSRQFRNGRVFVWCDEAAAYEAVPPERWKGIFHIKRLWRSGTITGEWMRSGRLPSTLLARNLLGLGACVAVSPVSVMLPKHVRMRVAQKLAYFAGVVTAYLGFSLMRHRD